MQPDNVEAATNGVGAGSGIGSKVMAKGKGSDRGTSRLSRGERGSGHGPGFAA